MRRIARSSFRLALAAALTCLVVVGCTAPAGGAASSSGASPAAAGSSVPASVGPSPSAVDRYDY